MTNRAFLKSAFSFFLFFIIALRLFTRMVPNDLRLAGYTLKSGCRSVRVGGFSREWSSISTIQQPTSRGD